MVVKQLSLLMKTLVKTLLVAAALTLGVLAHAQTAQYQVSSQDASVKQLLARWADAEEVDFEWNATFDVRIDHATLEVKQLNAALARAEDLHDAVLLVIDTWKNHIPDSKKDSVKPLDFCYYEGEAILVYTSDQPNCGHVEPSAPEEDEE